MSRRSLLQLRTALAAFPSHTAPAEGVLIGQKIVGSSSGGFPSPSGTRELFTLTTRLLGNSGSCTSCDKTALGQQRRQFIGESALGKHHHERKLLGYTQDQLYAVVSDVKHYKEFVPWCQRSIVTHERLPEYLEAELEVGFKMFVERYTSQVYMTEPSKVISRVSDSTLFDNLDTTWEFKAGPTPSTTWLNFDLSFTFKSPLYRHIASIFFDEVVKRMMGAFENRCKELYGESSLQQKRKMHA